MTKNLAIIIKASQEFIRHTDDEIISNKPELTTLFESISDTYIPLLNMIDNMKQDGLEFRIGLVLPPVLCALLNSSKIQNLYIEWLDKKNELGLNELKNAADEKCKSLISAYIEKNNQTKIDFIEKYQCKLIPRFSELRKKGVVEILATCGTDIFIPHYSDIPEVISAQIETGLHAYRQCFGEIPEGFWLPELGYIPGIEKLIRAYGYSYTVVSARSFLLSNDKISKGIFYPARTDNSLVLFASDFETNKMVFGENGFSNNEVYRNDNRDIGFSSPIEQLSPVMDEGCVRFATGYKYWNKSNENEIYSFEDSEEQVLEDADKFLAYQNERLTKAGQILTDSDFVTLVCTFDLEKFKFNWSEGLRWLEAVIRKTKNYSISVNSCDKLIEKQFTLQKISPYYASSNGAGYGEDFLSGKNSWMMRYTFKACQRMVDLADRFPNDTGLKARLLNMGAKELMIAMSTGLSKMLDEDFYSEYAEKRFRDSIIAFTMVFDSLGSNTVSTEWLTTLEDKDSIFPWMNYRIFSHKI